MEGNTALSREKELAGSALFDRGDPQIPADFSSQLIFYLSMAGHRRTLVLLRVQPPRMTATFTHKDAAILAQMSEQFAALHMVTSSSV
jgi:hypothetical protein